MILTFFLKLKREKLLQLIYCSYLSENNEKQVTKLFIVFRERLQLLTKDSTLKDALLMIKLDMNTNDPEIDHQRQNQDEFQIKDHPQIKDKPLIHHNPEAMKIILR